MASLNQGKDTDKMAVADWQDSRSRSTDKAEEMAVGEAYDPPPIHTARDANSAFGSLR